jgi:hypothetical protein
MDKSKMATPGTKIKYNINKTRDDQMSRPIKTTCNDWCCCDECTSEGGKSLDDTLNPPDEGDGCGPCCC